MSPELAVAAQFQAYNEHDIDAFVSCFAPDFKAYRMPAETPSMSLVRIMYIMLNEIFSYVPDFVTSIIYLAHCINRFLQSQTVVSSRLAPHTIFLQDNTRGHRYVRNSPYSCITLPLALLSCNLRCSSPILNKNLKLLDVT
ncbi:hypothetical protein ACIPUP_21075 [Pectobacterium actinidiae]|uniref:SnoaL-like domain-containing protein n=1 Tax=Pectobacterium actinidiae TaxID=1507808 RepID=A0ABW8GFZ3_9GAMM